MRIFCAAMLLASAGLYFAYGKFSNKAATTDDAAERLKALKKKFGTEFDELVDRFQKADTAAEKKGIQTEAKELAVITAEKVRKIAEADPKSETAFEAAQFALSRLVKIGAVVGDA